MDGSGAGLRVLKKQRTRRHIAAVAARLFADRGYEQITIADIARAAEVSQQTVYNYFPTKADLVTDRDDSVQESLSRLIRDRPAGTNPAVAVRPLVLGIVASGAQIPVEEWRGEIGYLAYISPEVHRLALEMIDRQAAVAAQAILETTPGISPSVAWVQGAALAGVFGLVFRECGRRTHEGQQLAQLCAELTVMIEGVFDELERWFG